MGSVEPMKIAVLGATGQMGSKVVDELRRRGHDVRPLHHSVGVDALTGAGLRQGLNGAEVVVDCLNHMTLSAGKAIDYFTTIAGNVTAAARSAHVERIVCLSIAGARNPAVNRWFGYYRGKAAQEETYIDAGAPVSIVHSTQWFEFPEMMAGMTAAGPLAIMPTMKSAPVSSGRVAAVLADLADGSLDAPGGAIAVRGPQAATIADFARRQLRYCGYLGDTGVRAVVEFPYLGPAFARGALIPRTGIADDTTFADWLQHG